MNRSSWTLGTVNLGDNLPAPARKHIGDNVIQVATGLVGADAPRWRSATATEATTFTPLPVAALPI